MAQVRADEEAGYVGLERQSSSQLRRQYSSHHQVPDEHHCIPADIDAELRVGFIRKVYGILAAQMILTVVIAGFCMSSHSIRLLVLHMFGSTVMRIAMFVPTLAVLCCMQAAKNHYPANYLLLFAFTVLMALDVGLVCAAYTEAGLGLLILQAFGLTAIIFSSLTAYTCMSKRDFSFMGGFLYAGLMVMLVAGFAGFLFPSLVHNLVYSTCGALLFCGYIVYDTFRITKVFGYDDYIIAAIELYLDIINLFLYILQMLSESR